jgi:hypothetical protein
MRTPSAAVVITGIAGRRAFSYLGEKAMMNFEAARPQVLLAIEDAGLNFVHLPRIDSLCVVLETMQLDP